MSESETESETMERLEAALRKIAAAKPRKAPDAQIDRAALVQSLDTIIVRLRGGLEKHNGTE